MVAFADAVPPAPVTVAVYFVVADGVTETLPEVPNELPIPLSILTEVAFVVVQVRTAYEPFVILVGLALNEIVGAGCVTVTFAVAELLPPDPETLSV
jgi:hypothetical protein